MAIAAIATGAGMLAFRRFLIGMPNELQTIESAGPIKCIVIAIYGIWGGGLIPLPILYKALM